MKSETIKLRNQIEQNLISVYAFNPLDRALISSHLDEAPVTCIFYPNEFVPRGEMHEANLADENLKSFLFSEILPKTNFMVGRQK